ncbi:MAG: DUF6067 family protein [Planctomycetaceae bacterium]|nr:DUF6067 family protein [Planctomycetaceae bacterium]
MKKLFLVLLSFFICSVAVSAADIAIPQLSDWKLTSTGKIVDNNIFEVTGDGKSTSQWLSPDIELKSGVQYRFSVEIKGVDASGGCLPCGVSGFSRDYRAEKDNWKTHSFCFQAGSNQTKAKLRVGQWESTGTFQFKNPKLETVVPVLKRTEFQLGSEKTFLILGEGEKIQDGVYTFNSAFGGEGANIHRPFVSANASFNSDRFPFGSNSNLTYCFSLVPEGKTAPIPFGSAKVTVSANYFVRGEGLVEVSKDGENWTEVGRITKIGTTDCQVPQSLFPLDKICVRVTGLQGASFQVNSVGIEAPLGKYQGLDAKQIDVRGETIYATASGNPPAAADKLYLTDSEVVVITPQETKKFPIEKSTTPGTATQKIELPGRFYTFQTITNSFERTDYGYYINEQVWWAEADWKVPRKRIVPAPETKKQILITAAKNDFEDFQIVVKAADNAPIQNLTGSVTDLKSGNNIIPAKNVELLYAYYHFVHSKTDATAMIADYPDALPPLDKPLTVAAGNNQPVWICVKVPADAAAGTYTGTVELTAEKGMKPLVIPFAVKVWNFALPKVNRHETAYGFNPGLAFQYHNAKTDADKRKVLDSYWQLFADHRISIYDPTPLDNFSVKWLPDDNEPEKSKCEIDFSRCDAELSRVIEKYNFSHFRVRGYGLGSGTFHARTDPAILKYGEDTPQYKAMMADYYTKYVNHLKEKNWLEKAYVYWFDEPAPRDYEFVANGTAKLQKYAPGLSRMMTEEPNPGFLEALKKANTTLDIWCPVSYNFDYDAARKRMDKGERFWWYVCTGPKAPYCTLFIDHPATELRVWHWQAWQREVIGSLVWQSNYWTSNAAFPDSFQNPYEDPMGYVSGYSTPKGSKAKWGNGDGRFIYPPLSAAVPGMNDGKPNFDKPVSSIRWEMIREGVEDYEMFYKLRELVKDLAGKLSDAEREAANKLLEVPESVSRTMTDFTIDPRPLYEHRQKVGDMLEKLIEKAQKPAAASTNTKGWQLVWEDNFDKLDDKVWSKIPRGRSDWNNYMSDYEPLYDVKDGKLILRGMVNPGLPNDDVPFITGGVYTKDKKGFLGKIEIKAKLGNAKGAWPAFWLLPFDKNAKYPNGGEIDIMERLNGEGIAYQTVHSFYTLNLKQSKPPKGGTGPIHNNEYNVYAVELFPDKLVFSINGKHTLTYPKIETDLEGQFPFNQPYYLMLDMQLGGNWVGAVDPKDLPVEMYIDWVRYYEWKE